MNVPISQICSHDERPTARRSKSVPVRSLPHDQWPAADRTAWADACRPAQRLKRGGAAAHMKAITRDDLARRYGYLLDFMKRTQVLDADAKAAAHVTASNVALFLAELQARVSSVTVYGSIYKVRRVAQLLSPGQDFGWLCEIEKDLALVVQPRSKFDRLVLTEVLIDAGMTLMREADVATHRSALARARQFRNGLMVALIAVCPIRLKNFFTLEIGRTFAHVRGSWWIVLPASETKEESADERPLPELLTQWVDRYLRNHRPILRRTADKSGALWLSSNDGRPSSYAGIERTISQTTLATVGVDVSPHLFRTAGASSAAIHAGRFPHLASALLHHRHPTVTEEHYNRASSMSAAQAYGAIVRKLQHRE